MRFYFGYGYFRSDFISLIRNDDYLEHEEFNVVSAAPKKGLAS